MNERPRLRLLRLGSVAPLDLHAAYVGLAETISVADQSGWLVLGRSATGHVALGASQYADAELDLPACRAGAVPVIQRPLGGGTVWVDDAQLCVFFVLPGRASRDAVYSRCLGVLADTFERLGLRVEQVGGQDIWCAGVKLLGSGGATIGQAQVFGASFLERFDARAFAGCVAAPSEGFRVWLGDLLDEGMTDLARLGVRAGETQLVDALSASCSEHWRLVDAVPEESARAAIALAARELSEPLEAGGRRLVRGGIKINRRTYLLEDGAGPWIRVVWRAGRLERAAAGAPEVERALCACLGEPLVEGLVHAAALRQGMTQAAALELERRVATLLRDAGR